MSCLFNLNDTNTFDENFALMQGGAISVDLGEYIQSNSTVFSHNKANISFGDVSLPGNQFSFSFNMNQTTGWKANMTITPHG